MGFNQKITNLTGVVLCGGTGSRLYPLTANVNKHLLPIYSKPMINYSVSTLLLLGIQKIVIVCDPKDISSFTEVLSFAFDSRIQLTFAEQKSPEGVADGISQALPFIDTSHAVIILGDNIFFGTQIMGEISNGLSAKHECTIFSYSVKYPERFGVVQRNLSGDVIRFLEKPAEFISNEVVTGLYYFNVNSLARKLKKNTRSERGELEITSILNSYVNENSANVSNLSRGNFWIDAGTIEDLMVASEFVKSYESRAGRLIACNEEIAFNNGWIGAEKLKHLASKYPDGSYRDYILTLLYMK